MQDINKPASAVNPIHPSVVDRLDPIFLKLYNAHIANVPLSLDLHEVRCDYSFLYDYAKKKPTPVGGIGETTVPGWDKYPEDIPIKVYVPEERSPQGEDLGERKIWPVHFNFHGGGWAVGDLATDQYICHHIAACVPCCVIDIGYRLVPEYPFPTGIMDAFFAVKNIIKNARIFCIDTSRMTFGGISTGGTIALILNHLIRDAGRGNLVKGVIVATPPITDLKKFATAAQSPYPSMREAEFAPLLNWPKLKWFETLKWLSMAPSARNGKPEELPKEVSWFLDLMTTPNCKDLAPITWIGTAECDPLRDEAEAYAAKLKENGNKVITKRYTGVPHHFMYFDNILPQAGEYINDVILQIRQCHYPPTTHGP